jgi:hypothetical protein
MNYFILAYIFEEQRYNYLLNVNYDREHQIYFYAIFFPPQPQLFLLWTVWLQNVS